MVSHWALQGGLCSVVGDTVNHVARFMAEENVMGGCLGRGVGNRHRGLYLCVCVCGGVISVGVGWGWFCFVGVEGFGSRGGGGPLLTPAPLPLRPPPPPCRWPARPPLTHSGPRVTAPSIPLPEPCTA